MARKIIAELDISDDIFITVTKPGEKTDIVITIEDSSGNCYDIQTKGARRLYDALGKALGE